MIKILKNTTLFKGVAENEISKYILTEKCIMKQYKKGGILAEEGERCNNISIVIKGKIQVEKLCYNGKNIILSTFKVGDVFGTTQLFSNRDEYEGRVRCINECEILTLSKNTIIKIMEQNKRVCENIMGNLCERINYLNREVEFLKLDTIRKKICKLLLDSYRESGSVIFTYDSKSEMAKRIGIDRTSFLREEKKMKEEGFIESFLKGIRILDLEKLQNELFTNLKK